MKFQNLEKAKILDVLRRQDGGDWTGAVLYPDRHIVHEYSAPSGRLYLIVECSHRLGETFRWGTVVDTDGVMESAAYGYSSLSNGGNLGSLERAKNAVDFWDARLEDEIQILGKYEARERAEYPNGRPRQVLQSWENGEVAYEDDYEGAPLATSCEIYGGAQ